MGERGHGYYYRPETIVNAYETDAKKSAKYDYNEWNGIGMSQNKIFIGPNDALLGLRVGGGKKMPIQFIDFGQSMRLSKNRMHGYHFRINIWRDGMHGKGMKNSKNEDNIDFISK
jgi:hypothetical protein